MTTNMCLTEGCTKPRAPALNRGLCLTCHSKARKMVEAGTTTWVALEAMGLVLPTADLFDRAFDRATNKERHATEDQ